MSAALPFLLRNVRSAIAGAVVVLVTTATAACSDSKPKPPPTHGYVGAAACAECHAERWETFRATGHHNTSSLASAATIKGPFLPPGNVMATSNPGLTFQMDAHGDHFTQTSRERDGGGGAKVRTERFDIVVGSGKLGQSYLWWRGNELFQLPVSYFTPGAAWMNSPGDIYVDGKVQFDRPIPPRCIECHATWLVPLGSAAGGASNHNAFDPDDVVLGVSCERCHGPGAQHIAWHRANPAATDARWVVKPAELPRERSLDLCGQCHGGVGKPVAPAFAYRPGLPLDRYVRQPLSGKAPPSLHSANQLRRLQQSRCFLESGTLTCVSCHDPHVRERGDAALFSKRCLKCHEADACKECAKVGHGAETDCVPCHMPREEVQGTGFQTAGLKVHPYMADHKVRIDRAASDRWIAERDGK